jgi:hypothetical protein
MPPAPLVVSVLLALSAVFGSIGLALDPDPFSAQTATLIGAGGGVLTVITVSGVLLARGAWSRWMALTTATLWFIPPIAGTLDAWDGLTMAATIGVATIAAGPWMGRWLRHLPSANGPPASAVILLLLLAATPLTTGFAAWGDSPGIAAVILVLWSGFLALGLARALAPALWLGRIGHLPLAAVTGVLIGLPAAVAIVAKAAIESILLWRRDLHLAVSPLVPQHGTTVAIPPELVDPAIMKAAGLDDRGRPLEES